jgi:hypothetical protein
LQYADVVVVVVAVEVVVVVAVVVVAVVLKYSIKIIFEIKNKENLPCTCCPCS